MRRRSRNLKHVYCPLLSPRSEWREVRLSLEKFIKTTGRIFDGKFRRKFETRSWMESWKVAALRILFQRAPRRFTRREIHYASKFPTDPLPPHVARNFFALIAFQIFRPPSFLTAILAARANVKQWKILSSLFSVTLFYSPRRYSLRNDVFSPLPPLLFFPFFSFPYANEFRSIEWKFQRVQTSDFSEGGYVVRAQGLDSEVTGKSEASMPNEGLSAPQGALAQRRYTAAPSQRPQDSTQTVSLLLL